MQLYDTPKGVVIGSQFEPNTTQSWKPPITQVREAALSHRITGLHIAPYNFDQAALDHLPSQAEVEITGDLVRDAFAAGRAIDFGYLPNDVIKFGGMRGGPLWNEHALGPPFTDPWIIYHTWEQAASVYLVNPHPHGRIELCELMPVEGSISGIHMRVLMLGDRALLMPRNDASWNVKAYRACFAPSVWRYLPGASEEVNHGMSPEDAAAGNVIDPLMTALLIVNTRNIDRVTICADPKLQRARKKNGKPPIPNYDRVDTQAYVTAIMTRGMRRERGEDKGGHHRSPVPHIRMGHPREYASGRSIFIRDTLVNVPADQRASFKAGRSHYKVGG